MRTTRWLRALLTIACLGAVATAPAAAIGEWAWGDAGRADVLIIADERDRGGRQIRVMEDEDTRCVTERRVSSSSFAVRTVCVSPPPPDEALQVRTRSPASAFSDGISADERSREDLGFSLIG